MNVYDFDGTIFSSDCSIGFCIWCMNRHPRLWFTFFPKAVRNPHLLPHHLRSDCSRQLKGFTGVFQIVKPKLRFPP